MTAALFVAILSQRKCFNMAERLDDRSGETLLAPCAEKGFQDNFSMFT